MNVHAIDRSYELRQTIELCLGFPGAFSPTGLFGAGLQSAVWLYWLWHSGLPLSIIGYTLLKEADRPIDDRRTGVAIRFSIAATLGLVVGMFWFVTQHHELLPVCPEFS